MPVYDYQCKHCKTVFEVHATFKEKEAGLEPECPQCHSMKTRQLLASGCSCATAKTARPRSFPRADRMPVQGVAVDKFA